MTLLPDETTVYQAGKRLGLLWAPQMGDFFLSWSPRNSRGDAEGPWDHWIDLALLILSDPLTELVRPEVYDASLAEDVQNFYDEVGRELTQAELRDRFEQGTSQ